MSNNNQKVWFITGSSTGFGHEIAKQALKRGYRVVATARDPQKLQQLIEAYPQQAIALSLDVTDKTQIEQAVKDTINTFGQIDVLVNNAGYGSFGAIEEVTEQEIRYQFEVNFFGLVNVTRAVLPVMRQARSGHILMMSSLAGQNARAGYGYYAATKFAVEAVSESLAQEVAPLNINITIVEPSGFRTDFNGRSLRTPDNRISDYADTVGVFLDQAVAADGKQSGDPVKAVAAMIELVESNNPSLRLPLGEGAVEAIRVKLRSVQQDVDRHEQTAIGADSPSATTVK